MDRRWARICAPCVGLMRRTPAELLDCDSAGAACFFPHAVVGGEREIEREGESDRACVCVCERASFLRNCPERAGLRRRSPTLEKKSQGIRLSGLVNGATFAASCFLAIVRAGKGAIAATDRLSSFLCLLRLVFSRTRTAKGAIAATNKLSSRVSRASLSISRASLSISPSLPASLQTLGRVECAVASAPAPPGLRTISPPTLTLVFSVPSVLFIGTQFSILYTSVYPPAGAACLLLLRSTAPPV